MRARATRTTTAAALALALLLSAPPAFVRSFSVGPSPVAVTANGAGIRRGGSIDGGSSARTPSTTRSRCSAATTRPRMSATPFNYGQRQVARQNVRLPLLVDIAKGDEQPRYDVPLPNGHLPPELTTASLYELRLDVPLHRTVIQDAVSSAKASDSPFAEEGCQYGHVVHSPDGADGLAGAIGCAGEILIGAPSATNAEDLLAGDKDDSGPLFVLARGSFRFRVREVVSSIPYPVAIVDELLDDDVPDEIEGDNDDDDDEDDDIYNTLQSKDLIKEIFQSLDQILKVQAEATETPLSPLEMDILENAPSSAPMAQAVQRRLDAEERIAVFQTFTSSLLDIAPDERDRTFAVAMMAGELANLPRESRARMLATTDGARRLRAVLRELTAVLSLDAARRVTKSLSLGGGGEGGDINTDARSLQEAEDEKKQLQVGAPRLPPWADQIQKGARVEYYWNEELEWCAGTIVEDPVKIMEEILLDVKFDDDGSVHKLPFRGDEKARWRPPKGNSGAFD